MSIGLCGGQRVPYRSGRVDALQADPTVGVPAPETNLEETLVFFERAGFDQTDSIGLTACGHTMGSVHHVSLHALTNTPGYFPSSNHSTQASLVKHASGCLIHLLQGGFPDVVPESAVTPNNTNGGLSFDTTRVAFDTKVVHEYIDWTGNKGGPLVTTNNITTRSDLRLYESDGNATMQALYDIGDGFLGTCIDLMGRMINTVPAGVELGSPISPMDIKPVNVTFDVDEQGGMELSGKIRVCGLVCEVIPGE